MGSSTGMDIQYYGFLDPCIVDGKVYTRPNMTKVPGNTVDIELKNGTLIDGPGQCLYGLSSAYLQDFSRNINSFIFDVGPENCLSNADYSLADCTSHWWLGPFVNDGNASLDSINARMGSMKLPILDTITNQLRMNGTSWYGTRTSVEGTAYQTVVCTQFEWAWLLFPAGIVLAAAVLLAAMAWESHRHHHSRVPVWKTSVLPMLFYGLWDEGMRLRQAVEHKDFVTSARGVKVRLSVVEEDGLRFCRA